MMQRLTPFRVIIMGFLVTALTGCLSRPPLRLSTPLNTAPKSTIPSTPTTATQIIPGQKSALVAVILPQTNASLSLAATAVHNGIEAARQQSGTTNTMLTRYYYTTDDIASPILQYQRAINDGAVIVIGPLTKIATDNLVRNTALTIPTFLLNTVNYPEKLPSHSYVMSLSIEEESRQMAETIKHNGHADVIIVYTASKLSHRIGQAFATQWRKVTDKLPKAIVISTPDTDIAELKRLMGQQENTALFLALTANEASHIVPQLQNTHPLYGISQIAPEYRQPAQIHALKGIQYTDIPLFFTPDKFSLYTHPPAPSRDLERLYALGMDVYQQVIFYLQSKKIPRVYDGAAGRWQKTAGQILQRQLPSATIGQSAVDALP